MADGLTDQVGRPIFQNLAGPHDYAPTIDAMRDHAAAIRSGRVPEAVWLLEHAPVYTAGTSAKDADLLNPGNTPTHKEKKMNMYDSLICKFMFENLIKSYTCNLKACLILDFCSGYRVCVW